MYIFCSEEHLAFHRRARSWQIFTGYWLYLKGLFIHLQLKLVQMIVWLLKPTKALCPVARKAAVHTHSLCLPFPSAFRKKSPALEELNQVKLQSVSAFGQSEWYKTGHDVNKGLVPDWKLCVTGLLRHCYFQRSWRRLSIVKRSE